jgi:hypothetical protein
VLAVFGEPRRMAADAVPVAILRDAAKRPLLRMTARFCWTMTLLPALFIITALG